MGVQVKEFNDLGAVGEASDVQDASDSFVGRVIYEIENLGGTWTVTFEGRIPGGSAFFAVQATKLDDGTGVTTATQATPGLYRMNASGLETQVRMSAFTAGPGARVRRKPVVG